MKTIECIDLCEVNTTIRKIVQERMRQSQFSLGTHHGSQQNWDRDDRGFVFR